MTAPRRGRAVGVAVAAAALVAVTALPAATLLLGEEPGRRGWLATSAVAEIPPLFLALYQEAAATRCPGLPWPVLAAIGRVETGHGSNPNVSSAGAMGPMQFLPSTWRSFGLDGDGDGAADILNPADAIHSAAGYLCAFGGADPARLRSAIFAYNHATWYVDMVLEHAARYAALVTGDEQVAEGLADVAALLANPNLVLSSPARQDLQMGRIDPRVVAVLALGSASPTLGVTVLQTGHSKYVAGTRSVSNHWCGQAADIFTVAGEAVGPASAAARAFTEYLVALPAPLRPDEIGVPFYDLESVPGVFANAAHQRHVHVGFGPRCPG